MNTNICSAIACPFWSNDHRKSYGCQRYHSAEACHLKFTHPDIAASEYNLSADSVPSGLKQENNRFFLEDPHYQDKLEFFEEFPEMKDCSFVPTDIRGQK